MKSAYELAMERLEAANGPSKRLNDDEKAALAEIDKKCDADIAGIRIDFEARISSAGSHEEYAALKEELAVEIGRIEERRERDKNAIWEDA